MVLLHGVVPIVLRLHVLQKRALRAVSNSEYGSHSNPLFIKYKQLKISDFCNHNIGIFM